jgi:MFS family permease
MTARPQELRPGPEPADAAAASSAPSFSDPDLRRNYGAWVGYQLFYRIGWQFKMEATMVAGLVSYLSPSASVMGLFTTVSNLGRYAAPFWATGLIDASPWKKRALMAFWLLTTLCWAAAALFLWTPAARNRGLALWWFFACYTAFFALLGCATVAQGALLGKIIPPTLRGRALGVTASISGPINMVAISIVYALARSGAYPAPRNYALAFTLTILFFILSALCLGRVREQPSPRVSRNPRLRDQFDRARNLMADHRNLRLLIVVNIALAVSGALLGFYTTFGRQSGSLNEQRVVLATLFQVFFQSVSSAILGPIADRKGNRALIGPLVWVEATIPLVALACGSVAGLRGSAWYLSVYALIGVRFPLYQLLVNYLLEILPMRDHAVALGLTNTLMIVTGAVPILFGALADVAGYGVVFVITSAVVVVAAVLCSRLEEPRVSATKDGV